MAKMIAVTSGKGGAGKTGVSVNLAIYLAGKGYRTCLFDADLGLANINILLNLTPEYNLSDVLLNKTALDQILIRNVYGIDIIPGSSGIEEMADLSPERLQSLMTVFAGLDQYDYIIFDTSAGTSKNVMSLCMASEEIVIVIVPEPASLTDAYALIKILAVNGYAGTPKVVVNQSKTPDSALKVFQKFTQTIHKCLPVSPVYIGHIPKDPHVVDAATRHKPVLVLHPDCKASKHIRLAGDDFIAHTESTPSTNNLKTFLQRYLQVLNRPLALPDREKETATLFPEDDVKRLLTTLVDTMKGISQELQAIRIVAEHMTKGQTGNNNSIFPPAPPSSTNDPFKSITIDFEAYKKQQKKP